MIVNGESKLQRTRHSPGSHGVVKLKHHPGIIKLPRCHKWQQGVLRDQPHQVSEPWVSGQCWHIVIGLPMEVSVVQIYIPQNRGPSEQWTPDPRGR